MELDKILTEKRNPLTKEIDRLTSYEIVKLINEEDKKIADAIEDKLPAISDLVDVIHNKLNAGGRLIYVGAGTSGRLGVLDASECPPTFSTEEDQVLGIIAGGNHALRFAMEGAEDDKIQGEEDIAVHQVTEHDVVIGIAASGRTPYTIGAMEEAKKRGAVIGCVVCSPSSEMEAIADHPIVIEVGPEVITGSTRMKAGSAQKMVLNMLSTASMIQLGKVYSNLMVDVMASNEKLRERAKFIVAEATGVDMESAGMALAEHGSTKGAILSILTGVEGSLIDVTLTRNNGHLRKSLEELKSS